MGYDTGFNGEFAVSPPLTREHKRDLEELIEDNDYECQWVPNDDGTAIVWDEGGKFYDYVDHLKDMITEFLDARGCRLNGIVTWHGEEYRDVGTIWVQDNVVNVLTGAAIPCEQLLSSIFGGNGCQQCQSRAACFPEGT